MTNIHSSAIVSSKAELADDVTVGPYSVIEDDVVVGSGTRIASHVVLASGARLGRNVTISPGVVIGTWPQDLKFNGEKTEAIIGDNTTLREYVTVNRGTLAHRKSVVGANCLLMAYAHVAHDCVVGDNVILANAVNMGGHVEIDHHAIIGGMCPIHQFTKIGSHVMIGGGFRVVQDVVPYALVGGYPLRVAGINAIGLKRRGFSREVLKEIDGAFKTLFFSGLNTTQALETLASGGTPIPEVQVILDFIKRSTRGLVKARHHSEH